MRWPALLALCGAMVSPVAAHEVRPAYLGIRELDADRFGIVWKQPARPDRRLAIEPIFPPACVSVADGAVEETPGAILRRWEIDCEAGLRGGVIRIDGLERTMTDVLFEARFADGESFSSVIGPENPSRLIDPRRGAAAIDYLRLGIEHLWLGVDHILFVVGLTLLVRTPLRLLETCSAFTLAHSLTLGFSSLGVLSVSPRPVEAVIALSVLFLAVELTRQPGPRPTLTRRHPGAMALAFGLLHGFGFAGALGEVGLPKDALVPALLSFNVGLEIGQLIVIAVVGCGLAALRRLPEAIARGALRLPACAMGAVSAFWFLDRLLPPG